jgi:uncharacterized protein with HEPN domain
MRDDRERLTDISTAIDRILSKTTQGRNDFDADEMLQVWVLHHLQIVGEAARRLSEEFRRLHPDPVWSKPRVCGTYSFTTILKSTPAKSGR